MSSPKRKQLRGRFWALITQVGAFGLAAAGSAIEGNWIIAGQHVPKQLIVIGIAVCVLIANLLITERREVTLRSAARLTARAVRSERALLGAIRGELHDLQNSNSHYSNERASIFVCKDDGFILVGRRSANPKYDRSSGRVKYPLDEGCLGAAWRDGHAEVKNLPSAGGAAQPTQQWLREQERTCKVPSEVAAQFTMRSHSYLAFRIQSAQSDRSLGVLVFESTLSPRDVLDGRAHPLDRAALEPQVKRAALRLGRLIEGITGISADEIRGHLAEFYQGGP